MDYEGGAKIYFLDHKLYLDATYYHINWSNQQTSLEAHGTFNFTLNVGKTVTDGVEVSSTYKPVSGLTLSGALNYVDARLGADLPAYVIADGNPGLKGDRVPLVPFWSNSGQAEYEHLLAGHVKGYVSTDFTHRGSSYTLSLREGTSDYTNLPSYFLVDLNAGVRFNQYDISVFAQNVANKVAYSGLYPDYDAYRVFSPPPRTIGLRFQAHF